MENTISDSLICMPDFTCVSETMVPGSVLPWLWELVNLIVFLQDFSLWFLLLLLRDSKNEVDFLLLVLNMWSTIM